MVWDLADLFRAKKKLPGAPKWVEKDSDRVSIISSLEIDGVIIEAFRLRATARKSMPDEVVTFQMEYFLGTGKGGPICRLDWKPLSGHQNKGIGPASLRHMSIVGSHYHRFDINKQYASGAMKNGNLPLAVPLSDDPKDFSDLLDMVAKEFRISNLGLVRE